MYAVYNMEMKIMVEKLKKDGTLMYVGDGINDAPTLASSDVAVAMGGVGSDSAIEASDCVIMDDDISKITKAIAISHKTDVIVKENIVFSLFVKALVFILALMGIANMWLAVFADTGVSLLAVANSLRALFYKEKWYFLLEFLFPLRWIIKNKLDRKKDFSVLKLSRRVIIKAWLE